MRIAYIVPTSTLLTYIYNELIEVQESGHDVVLVPLRYSSPFDSPLRASSRLKPLKTLPSSLCNARILYLSLRMFLTRPFRVLPFFFRCTGVQA